MNDNFLELCTHAENECNGFFFFKSNEKDGIAIKTKIDDWFNKEGLEYLTYVSENPDFYLEQTTEISKQIKYITDKETLIGWTYVLIFNIYCLVQLNVIPQDNFNGYMVIYGNE